MNGLLQAHPPTISYGVIGCSMYENENSILCCVATPAYGFNLIDGKLTINEDEAKIVRKIFDMYLQGVGKQRIADTLNEESVPKKYGEKKWHHSMISYILSNERYMKSNECSVAGR